MRKTLHIRLERAGNRFYAQETASDGERLTVTFVPRTQDAAESVSAASSHFVSDSPEFPTRTRRRTCAVCRSTLTEQETRRGWTHLYCSNQCRQVAKRHRATLRNPGPNAWIWRRTPTGGGQIWIVETLDGRFRVETNGGAVIAQRRTYAGAYAFAACAALDYRHIGFQPALCAPANPTQNDDNN
jgi:hypothetical protein